MLAFLLLIDLICIAVGIIGFVVHGLFWLFIIGTVVFLATVLFGGTRLRSSRSR